MASHMTFLRDDLAQLAAYQSPHPNTDEAQPILDPLDTNESPIDLPGEIKASLAKAYANDIEANRYPDGSQFALKQAVMGYAISSGSLEPGTGTITPENVTLGNGSDELIRSVIMATCLGDNGSILVATPTFSMYGILAKTLGVTVRSVTRTETFAVDITAAQAAIDAAKTENPPIRVVFMVHPNSPTGNALTRVELAWLRQLPSDILVVIDEAYFEFSGHTTLADALNRPNWLITRTFSKAFRLAAHRVGYGIGHPNLIAALEKLRLPYNLPSFSQAAANAALTHADQLLTQISTIVSERQKLLAALTGHPHLQVWPSDSNFIYVRLSDRGLTKLEAATQSDGLTKLLYQLKAHGTLIRHTGGGLRISIGTAPENQRTLANLQRILDDKT